MPHQKTRRQIIQEAGAAAAVSTLGSLATVGLAEHARGAAVPALRTRRLPSRLAFGSCANQKKPQPVLRTVAANRPDLFIYLGDNVYADTQDMDHMRAQYALLAAKPEFQELRASVPLLAVWDDHDYGENDAGKEYAKKEESREIFFDFWGVPADSPRRSRPGIYGEHRFRSRGRVLQALLLDTRTFRDPLKKNSGKPPFKNDYEPDPDPSKTMLGVAQWRWLEERLRQPADLRIVCTSNQFAHEYNGWESWTNLPAEQERMLSLIGETRANGVVFISGDVHWGEISRRDLPGGYPLYDVTASGITETWDTTEPNRYRQGSLVRENHFGMIDVDWARADPEVALQIVDVTGTVRVREVTALSRLRFPA